MDILRSSGEWLEGKRKAYLSQSVMYRRGAITLAISVTFGETTFADVEAEQVLSDVRTKDFIVTVADFQATFDKPLAGDTIEYTEGEENLIFEVKAPAGLPVFENDSYRLSYRIHTQLTGQEVC